MAIAVAAAGLAILVVVIAGVAIRAPLASVPENTLKYAVGVMLTTYGVFWVGEGLGVELARRRRGAARDRGRGARRVAARGPLAARAGQASQRQRIAARGPWAASRHRTLENVPAIMASTSVGQSITSFLDAAGQFFSDLAAVHWPALLLGLLLFGLNLTLRSRAYFNSLRAAYPAVPFQWRRIWGAYVAAVGFNNIVPARGGDIIKLFLTRSSIPGSRYPTVAAAFFVEAIFDIVVGVVVLLFAFTQGVFPKPPDFSKLSSFDISYLAEHFRLTLFLITLLIVVVPGRVRAAVGARCRPSGSGCARA